jgi:regulator of protease activity HflC (stomatin/prohibitin superfamily)
MINNKSNPTSPHNPMSEGFQSIRQPNEPVHDYRESIYAALPQSARKYHMSSKSHKLDEVLAVVSVGEKMWKYLNLMRVYPCMRIRYVNSNEIIPILINGHHRLYMGPGYFTAVGIADKVFSPVLIGDDIIFGPVKLIYVKPGTYKYALNIAESRPMLLEPGMHYFDDANVSIGRNEISLNSNSNNAIIPIGDSGAFYFIFVKTGSQGVINKRNGELEILEAGIHFLESPDSFKTFVSVQQEHIKFGTCETAAKHKFLTADNLELEVDATLFYKITDVKRVFTTSIKDHEDLVQTLLSQARSLLMTLIRSENFSSIGKKRMTNKMNKNLTAQFTTGDDGIETSSIAVAEAKLDMDNDINHSKNFMPSAPSASPVPTANPAEEMTMGFQSIIKDIEPQFKSLMQTNFGNTFGFEIQSLRIENIEFADKNMQQKVSELSMSFTQLSAQEATIVLQRKVEIAQAEREAQTAYIKTQAETNRKILEAKAQNEIAANKNRMENDLLLASTKAKTTALTMEAEVQAKNKVILADAEAGAIEKIGNAQYEINKKNGILPHAQVRIVADAQREALKGVNKVIYTNEQSLLMRPFFNMAEKDN